MTKTVYGREERPSKEVRGFRENHENQEVVTMLTSIALCSCRSVLFVAGGKGENMVSNSVPWVHQYSRIFGTLLCNLGTSGRRRAESVLDRVGAVIRIQERRISKWEIAGLSGPQGQIRSGAQRGG